jgi:hypothetical protein
MNTGWIGMHGLWSFLFKVYAVFMVIAFIGPGVEFQGFMILAMLYLLAKVSKVN